MIRGTIADVECRHAALRRMLTRIQTRHMDVEDFAAVWTAQRSCRRSLDSPVLGGSTTASRDDGVEADCDGRCKCAISKSAAAPDHMENMCGTECTVRTKLEGQILPSVQKGIAQSKPLQKPGRAPIALKAKDRVRFQAERCDELAVARLPEQRRYSSHQGHRRHRGDAFGLEEMYLVRAQECGR